MQSTHAKIPMEQDTVMNAQRNVTIGHTGDLHRGLYAIFAKRKKLKLFSNYLAIFSTATRGADKKICC